MTLVAEDRATGHGSGGGRPPSGEGLGSRLDRAVALLRQVLADLRPELLTGDDALTLYSSFVSAERLVVAGKSLLAHRIEDTSVWRDRGYATAAEFLAAIDGSGIGEARTALRRSRALTSLATTEEALRNGELSAAQATEIADAASSAPEVEADLVDSARKGASLTELRDDARRAKNSAAGRDPRERERRIHEGRYLRFRNDGEGPSGSTDGRRPTRGPCCRSWSRPRPTGWRAGRRRRPVDPRRLPPGRPHEPGHRTGRSAHPARRPVLGG